MKRAYRVCSAVLLSMLLSACTTTTGTRVQLTESQLKGIQTLGVYVQTNHQFSVRMAREEMTDTGALLGGLIGAGIESGVRDSQDKRRETALLPLSQRFDLRQTVADDLQKYLTAINLFTTVRPVDTDKWDALRANGVDAVLNVNLGQWGLIVCNSAGGKDKRTQVGIEAHEELLDLSSGKIIWERNEDYLDGDCRVFDDFESQSNLLTSLLGTAVDNMTGRIANEIRYPQTATKGAGP